MWYCLYLDAITLPYRYAKISGSRISYDTGINARGNQTLCSTPGIWTQLYNYSLPVFKTYREGQSNGVSFKRIINLIVCHFIEQKRQYRPRLCIPRQNRLRLCLAQYEDSPRHWMASWNLTPRLNKTIAWSMKFLV